MTEMVTLYSFELKYKRQTSVQRLELSDAVVLHFRYYNKRAMKPSHMPIPHITYHKETPPKCHLPTNPGREAGSSALPL